MKYCYMTFFMIFTLTAYAQDIENKRKSYTPFRVNPHSPSIDGKINDAVWEKTELGNGFIQHDPVEGEPASEKTYFKICYDDKNLYVLIHAYESEPEKITARLSRRDDVEDSDLVGIILDSYFDHRTAFEFGINAAGVKSDAVYADDGNSKDNSWDPVWEGKTSINDSGWVAEMRIPFSQLRFSTDNTEIWGMEIYRYIHRKQEVDQWQLISKDAPGFVSLFGTLTGLNGIKSPKRIELLPYSVSKYHSFEKEEGNPFATGRDHSITAGLDGKIGVTGNLTVDFTINPDFGQVEADPSEVNLSAFETFFEEKRPFFVEGKNIFQFPLGIGDGDFARETLFYSRRIGRPPHHEPDTNDDENIESPGQTSILGAAKLSGKTSNGWSLGILDALTAEEIAKIDSTGNQREEVVEPFTNYFVGRLQKDFFNGNTTFGGIVTATNRNINHGYLNYINKSAYTAGIDILHQWKDKTYFADLKASFSHVRGHKDALLDVQTASARYFQRPDANYVTLDSNRTSLSGHGGSLNFGKQGNGKWRYILGGIWRSPGFELNDIGYLRQADRLMQFVWVGYRIFNPVGIFRRVNVNFNQWNGWNFGGEKLFMGGNINGGAQFLNYWGFYMGINREGDALWTAALRGGPAMRDEGGWNNWYNIYSDSRKKWQFSFGGFNHLNDDGITKVNEYFFSLFWKPNNNINISTQPFYNSRLQNLQYIDTYEKANGDHYILGKLDQKTLGVIFRLNYSITPELTIQYYGQPFISTGEYNQFKEVTAPRAERYEDRFRTFEENQVSYNAENEEYEIDENSDGIVDYYFENPDFNFKEYRSNLVIRWEYHSGSQIYLVWSQGLSRSDDYGDFSLGRDLKDMFRVQSDNVFLVKLNHWFSL